MNRKLIAGAWQGGDALPDGRYAVAIEGRGVQTHSALVPLPGEDLLFVVCGVRGGTFVFAGQGANSGIAWEYVDGDRFYNRGLTFDVFPLVYDNNGTLIFATGPQSHQGYRFVGEDNRPRTGNETFFDGDVHEWTSLGGVKVGQKGEPDRAILTFGGLRKLLGTGFCHRLRLKVTGESLSIVVPKIIGNSGETEVIFATKSELASLSNDEVIPLPPPPPPPPPPPEPDMNFPQAEWAVVQQMHARFAPIFPATEDGARGWTEMTIEQLEFFFPNGGWCWKSSTPTSPPSKDCIARRVDGRFEGWDSLNAAGVNGPRVLADYPPIYHDLSGQHPIDVIGKNHLGDAPIPPPPPPPDEEPEVTQEEFDALAGVVVDLNDRLAALEGVPPIDVSNFVTKGTEITVRGTYSDRGAFSTSTKNIELKGTL